MLVWNKLLSPWPYKKHTIKTGDTRSFSPRSPVKRPRRAVVLSEQQTPGTMLLKEKKELVANAIRGVPDFPKKGILFWDITTLCLDPGAFRCCIEAFTERYKDKKIDVIAGQFILSSSGVALCRRQPRVLSACVRSDMQLYCRF